MTEEDTDELLEQVGNSYEIGRGEDLFTSQETQEIVYYDHERKKKYPFKIRELGWAESNRFESEAQILTMKGNTPDLKFDNAKCNRLCFCAMVVDSPFSGNLAHVYLRLGTKFGNWFRQYIPMPGGGISSEEQDLSDEQ